MGNVARPVMQASTAGCVWKRTGWQQSHSTSTCSAVLRGWAWGEASPRAGVGRHARLMTSFSCVYNERGGRIRFGPHSPARIGGAEASRVDREITASCCMDSLDPGVFYRKAFQSWSWQNADLPTCCQCAVGGDHTWGTYRLRN